MKNILTLIFCLCTVFSLVSFAKVKEQQTNVQLSLAVSKTTVKKEFPNIFRKIKNGVKRLFGNNRKPVKEYPPPIVKNVNLNKIVITTGCSLQQSPQNNSCLANAQSIEISVEVLTEGSDPDNVFTYVYKVSGGEIIGKGAKVVWNLGDVKPATYTISACVDDGIGCLKTIIKEVKVIECPDFK